MPKKPLLLILFLFVAFAGTLQAQQFINDKVDASTNSVTNLQNAVIYLPANYDKSKSYPLLLSMHGIGQANTDVTSLYNDGLPYVLKNGYKPSFDFIMIAPQRSSYSVDPNWLTGILSDARKRFSIDDSRIYLTGYDAGGWPVYGSQLNISAQLASQFAAIVVCSGATQDGNKDNLDWWKTTQTPLWAIVGEADASYRNQNSTMVDEINKRSSGAASLTIRSGIGHGGWNDVYKGIVKNGSMDMWQWLYQFQRINGAIVRTNKVTAQFSSGLAVLNAANNNKNNNATKSIPGRIKAEDYNDMSGVQTETTQDDTGGNNVGWIDNGDWMDYKVNAQSGGSFTVNFRIATPNGGQFQVRNADGTVLATVAVPRGRSYQVWETISTTLTLPAGAQTLRIYAVQGGWNLNWLEFISNNTGGNDAAKSIPGRIKAEDYNDMSGVQTEAAQDDTGGNNVGWIDNGDWMDYKVNAQSGGSFTVNFRIATPNGGQFQVRNADGTVLATVAVPKGRSYQVWETISTTLTLPAGAQTLRIYAVQGGWNLNWLEFISNNTDGNNAPTTDTVPDTTPANSDSNIDKSSSNNANNNTGTAGSIMLPTGVNASLYFDDGEKGKFTATCIRQGDVLSGLIDDNTGEAVTYTKTTTWINGSAMTNAKIDGVIYRKKGNEFFKRNYAGALQAQWFSPANGRTDNTQSLQNALDLLDAAGGGILEFKDGTYIITPTQKRRYSLTIPSNVTLNLSQNAIIKVGANSVNYSVFYINQATNVTINGGTIVGDKATHRQTSGADDMGVGININSSSNIKVSNITINNIWGDGIYVGRAWSVNGAVPACTNIVIDGVTIDGSRRDGITVTYADGVTISNSKITNSKGKSPEAGIVIEPNVGDITDYVRNFKLNNLYLANNAGVGIGSDAYKLTADNITAVNNGSFGIFLSTKNNTSESGDCFITNSQVEGNGTQTGSGGIGIKNTITIVSIKNTNVIKNVGYGIIVDNKGGPVTVSDSKITGSTERGFYAVGSNYTCTFTNNEVSNNGSHISLAVSNGTFSGNKVYKNGPPTNPNEGAVTVYGSGWKISSNNIYDNPTHGLYIAGSNNIVDGNTIYGNSQKQDGNYDNIKLVTGANNNVIQNNNISKGFFSNAPGYGIRINVGANNNKVTGNIMNGTGGKIADIIGSFVQ